MNLSAEPMEVVDAFVHFMYHFEYDCNGFLPKDDEYREDNLLRDLGFHVKMYLLADQASHSEMDVIDNTHETDCYTV